MRTWTGRCRHRKNKKEYSDVTQQDKPFDEDCKVSEQSRPLSGQEGESKKDKILHLLFWLVSYGEWR